MSLKEAIKNNQILYPIASQISTSAKKMLMYLYNKILGINHNKVVFVSWDGKSYADNPRAISEKMHLLRPQTEIVWLFNEPEKKRNIVPEYVRCVENNSRQSLKELATAKGWVLDSAIAASIYKSSKQLFLQTWHGDRAFKRVLLDIPDNPRSKCFESDLCNAMTVGSEFGAEKLEGAFGYHGEFLRYGSPRNDVLLKNNINEVNRIKSKLGIPAECKVLLYAPTFRDSINQKQDMQGMNLLEAKQRLEELYAENWVCLIRAHTYSKGISYNPAFADAIKDVSAYEDMRDLLLITDLLITDYSASAGDFILKKKLVILYHADLENYLANDRTLYFDADKSPYFIARNQNELLHLITATDSEAARKNCEAVMAFYGTFESGEASERAAEFIINHM